MEEHTGKNALEGTVQLEITGGQGEITTATTASCYYKNKSFYLLFEEGIGEDDRQNAIVFSSRLKISEDQVTLRRSLPGTQGGSSKPVMEMIYRKTDPKDPGHFVDYPTPCGKLRMEIRTDEIRRSTTPDGMTVCICYRLLQEGAEISRDRILIRIRKQS